MVEGNEGGIAEVVIVEVITTYYRETFLAPLFMSHYESWVDRVTIITERWDAGKMNDHKKTDAINQAIRRSTADWVICVDFDEFAFPVPITDPRDALANEAGHMMMCNMWRVWRHVTDKDIDRMQSPFSQRLHGEPDHQKPCIFRPRDVSVGIGLHSASFPQHYQWGKPWGAVHWAHADPCFGVDRSLNQRQKRLTQEQMASGLGVVADWHKPGFLENKFKQHMNDPVIPIET